MRVVRWMAALALMACGVSVCMAMEGRVVTMDGTPIQSDGRHMGPMLVNSIPSSGPLLITISPARQETVRQEYPASPDNRSPLASGRAFLATLVTTVGG